ncbi:MAG: DUF4920 domain-containing protein [Acidobacteria bacterium]|nr:DUF4920 domain-containing protein [Acidobacteriota bacterium]MCB9378179.1 DUF4920 domain-containing protein [Holophagales bacterium]
MRHSLVILVCALALPAAVRGEECAKKSYGAGVRLAESTPVSELLGTPDRWVGEQVRVEGEVAEVCEMAGCWLELRATGDDQMIKVKVKDGEIVFPTSARGKAAVAEGKFERLDFDREKYASYAKHAAEEKGQPFDEASIGDGPYYVYQIKGTGAEICE